MKTLSRIVMTLAVACLMSLAGTGCSGNQCVCSQSGANCKQACAADCKAACCKDQKKCGPDCKKDCCKDKNAKDEKAKS